ncbi:MAG: hypothetical protein AB7O66_18325, partial [Limisphaerales bacterium]
MSQPSLAWPVRWSFALLFSFAFVARGANQSFVIVPNQTVTNGVPSAGAGVLESPGDTDTYTFAATRGQRLFFDELTGNGCSGTLTWSLTGPEGQVLFNQRFAALSNCGSGPDAGTVVVPSDGTYTLVVRAPNDWVEAYSFRIVPIVDHAAVVAIGDTVTYSLATPGSVDSYAFTGAAGQRVFFDELTGNGCSGSLAWSLTAPDGEVLFNQRFAALSNCGSGPDAGTVDLPSGGTNTLQIRGANDWVEAYSFRIVPIVDHDAVVAIGDT